MEKFLDGRLHSDGVVSNTNISEILKTQHEMFTALKEQKNLVLEVLTDIKLLQDGTIRDLQSEIQSLLSEVQLLRNNIGAIPSQFNSNVPANTNDNSIYCEIRDRDVRAKNLMIFNIDENKSSETQIRIDNDYFKIKEVFATLEVELVTLKAIRDGTSNGKPRPLKVMLSDERQISLCLKHMYKLKNTGLGVGADLTRNQRTLLMSLKKELNNRLSNGEKDLVIRHEYEFITAKNPVKQSNVKSSAKDSKISSGSKND